MVPNTLAERLTVPRIRHFLEPGHVFMATDLAVEAAGNFLLQMSQPYDARLYLNNHPQCAPVWTWMQKACLPVRFLNGQNGHCSVSL